MQKIKTVLKKIANNHELRKKLLFTAGIFAAYRFLAHVPLPGINLLQLQAMFAGNQFLSLLNMFSGGTLANLSIMAVGINPYITASIIMQLTAMVIPQLKELQKDGEAGKEKVNQYTRLLSVPLAIVQSLSVLVLLRSQGLMTSFAPLTIVAMIFALVAGAMIMMWLGELISLYGIGNGISMILFAGIVSQLPTSVFQAFAASGNTDFVAMGSFALVALAIVGVIVYMNEAVRKLVIQYAKRIKGSRVYGGQMTHLPIRVNVAGVMPIIFAVTIMLVPSFASRLLISSGNNVMMHVGRWLSVYFNETAPLYILVYFLIVFLFTFFSAMIFFNAEDISGELKKSGAFIPGIRPGSATKKYLEFVVSRITLAGAIFLSTLAILPSLAQILTGINTLAISGTSLLIVVSVILETTKQAESMVVEQNYERYR
jgi:preprotein translocase subunit SecY